MRDDQSTGIGAGATREEGSIKREEPKSKGVQIAVRKKIGKTAAGKSTGKYPESIDVGDVGKCGKGKANGNKGRGS